MKNVKHGHCIGIQSRTYRTWGRMLDRCENPHNEHYADYGGRGISVCANWHDFANFLQDMGVRPEGRTLDRIDNLRGYEPENCLWATQSEQLRNTRRARLIVAFGKVQNLKDWSIEVNIPAQTILGRIAHGWPMELAVSSRPTKRRQHRDRREVI